MSLYLQNVNDLKYASSVSLLCIQKSHQSLPQEQLCMYGCACTAYKNQVCLVAMPMCTYILSSKVGPMLLSVWFYNPNLAWAMHCFLNQARAWFLDITFVWTSVCVCVACVCVCVCNYYYYYYYAQTSMQSIMCMY